MKDLHKFSKRQAGIYKITIGPHVYIGQSIDLDTRVKQHKSQLKSNIHPNYNFQQAYNQYGSSQLQTTILFKLNESLSCDLKKPVLNVLEQTYINILHADLNIKPVFSSNSHFKYKSFMPSSYRERLNTTRKKHPFLGTASNPIGPASLYFHNHITNTIGLKPFDILEREIPLIITNDKLRTLLFAILLSPFKSEQGYVVTSEEWVAYYVDEHKAYLSSNNKRFTAIKFLQALKDALPSNWEMEWTNFDYTQNKARTTRIKPPNHIIELLYQDIRDRPTPRYYVYKWGTKVTKDSCNFTTEALQQIQESHIQEVKCSLQEDILSYTNSRNIREFRYMNIQAAKDVIETYPVGKKEYYSHTLNTIIDYPKPIYHPVEACYRLFAPGLQFLKSDIRLALYPNSIELDLKSCHLAILAMLLDLNHTKEVLLGETSAWTHLLTHTARFISPFFYPLLKKAIKTTIYSLCFGASPLASKKIFKEKLISEGFTPTDIKPLWKAFTQIELVQELMVKTYTWRNQLLQDGEYIDPFGITHKVTGQNDVKTACFNICSAYELILIHPVYKVAQEELSKNRPLFRIMLHSHDGVTVSLAKPHLLKPVVKRLSQAVQEVAQNLNIYTTLEHKVIT